MVHSTQPPEVETKCEPSDQGREDQPGKRSAGLSASAPTRLQRRIEPPPLDVEQIDLSHVPDRLRERFRRMLKKYSRMWDGTLGEINTTVHLSCTEGDEVGSSSAELARSEGALVGCRETTRKGPVRGRARSAVGKVREKEWE